MNKILIIVLLSVSFVLSSCDEKEEPPTSICEEGQLELADGSCMDVGGPDVLIYNALFYTKGIQNYTSHVTITEGETDILLKIFVTENITMIETDNESNYYVNYEDGMCTHIKQLSNIIQTETIDCDNDSTYSFFKSFDYTWFTLIDGKFELNEENHKDVLPFFQTTFPGAELDNFKVSLADGYITSIEWDLIIGEDTLQMEMTIADVNEVVLTVPYTK